VREEDMPQINGLVKALFFSIRTSWVHNSTARPTAGDVGHMLQAAQLLSDLTLIAEGKSVPPRADRSEWGVPDLAEAASFHSVVFNVMSRATVNQRSNQEVSGHLESLFERESMRAADRNADPESGKEKVDYYKKYAHELVRGLAALSGTSVLPDGHTTAGVLARGAMVSLWLRLGFGQKSEVDFPLWQAYCEPVARQD
jgi:hypothetical protein